MEQLQEMKDDPRVKRRMDPAVRDVLDAWEEYEVAYDVLRYQTGSRASQARRSLRLRIFNMLEDYTRRNRSTRALYLRLMRPELNLDEADLAVQDATSQQRSTNFQQGVDAILSRQRQTVDQYR